MTIVATTCTGIMEVGYTYIEMVQVVNKLIENLRLDDGQREISSEMRKT